VGGIYLIYQIPRNLGNGILAGGDGSTV